MREHTSNERSILDRVRGQGLVLHRREVYLAAWEQRRRDASVARCRSGARDEGRCWRDGPSSWHLPSTRVAGLVWRGDWRFPRSQTTPAKIDCRRHPAKG